MMHLYTIEYHAIISFDVTGKVSRWEFDMKYNSVLEANSLLIDEDIDILIHLLLHKEQ
ncbi:hypothetical protein [Sphingobacterium faecium]